MSSYKTDKIIHSNAKPAPIMQAHKRLTTLLLSLLFLVLTGCQGLPDDVRKKAKAIPDSIEAAQEDIEKTQKQFTSLKKSDKFKPVSVYAQRENWDQMFAKANQALDRAREINKTGLIPLIKKNNPETSVQVVTQTKRISQIITAAGIQAKGPINRFLKISEAMEKTDGIHSNAGAIAQKITVQVSQLEKGPVAKAKNSFPDSVNKIDARLAPFLKIVQDTKTHLDIIDQEYSAHTSKGSPDFAAFIDNADKIFEDFKTLEQTRPVFERELDQLYESYTKVLQDMKTDFYVTIKRESWNENSDYYDPRFATFQRKISPSIYDSLVENEQEAIASLSPGFGGLSFSNKIGNTWKKLNINPTEQWAARNHNAASFWVDDAKEVYYHKYLKEENGETHETDWVKVDASFYEQNLEFLGMAVLSKPYGVFEQDRVTQATPPGMAYVGNDKYGEWKKDNSGNSFWSWYGKYALFSHLFFFPPSYFGYGGWNSWNNGYRNRQPYFGKTQNGKQQYGTRGSFVKQSPKYQSSTFSKTGGFKSQAASVRGGGAKIRGGGPKAKGK
jgi:hypothetical protein